jgi:hypothetical protein
MFVSVTTVDSSDRPLAEATVVGEEMEGWLRDVEGFEGILILFREGTTLGMTFWESEEAADRARTLRLQFLERITSVADVEVQNIDTFDVAFAALGPGLAEGVS